MSERPRQPVPFDRTRSARRAAVALRWGLLGFVMAQLACAVLLEWRQPAFYDPKYGCRVSRLRARVAGGRPRALVIVLGSSRSEQGFRPSLLPPGFGDQGTVVYNLARGGTSPLLNLLTLRRLLADGIRPDWLFLEIFPPSLVGEKAGVTVAKMTLRDIPVLWRYPVSWQSYAYFLRDRALLWPRYGGGLLTRLAPAWIPRDSRWDRLWDPRGGEWQVIGDTIALPECRRLVADAQRRYAPKLERFHVAADADRATRALLALCREHRIHVLLFLMPEATEFRRWYPPPAERRLRDYLALLGREYHAPLIDARAWVPDDDFWDGHHLLRRGAAHFMRRFGEEVLRLLVLARCNITPAAKLLP